QRVDGLGITSLSDEKRSAYARRWDAAQERFIDSPAQAVSMADSLVTAVAAERGYQAADDDVLLEDLSVYHRRHLDGYPTARPARPGRHHGGQAAGPAALPCPVLRPARGAGRRPCPRRPTACA